MNVPQRERWIDLWNLAQLSGEPSHHYDQLVRLYSEPGRYYHNLRHIAECLSQFDSVRHLASQPIEVELAIWFHDIVYDSHAHDNEQRSADIAREWLCAAGAGEPLVEAVSALILATRHNVSPADPDTQLLVDIDLSILGQNETRFLEYEGQIRQEYSWVPEAIFVEKRSEILQMFLARERIFTTDPFYKRFERQARRNLEGSIARLLGNVSEPSDGP